MKRNERTETFNETVRQFIQKFGLWIIFTFIMLLGYIVGKFTETVVNAQYDGYMYEEFVQYLQTNSPDAYLGASEKFMKKEYESWKSNKGYSDIIINDKGELENVYDDISYTDLIISMNQLESGIYVFSDDNYSYSIIINFTEARDQGTIILNRCDRNSGSTMNIIDTFKLKEDNIYTTGDSELLTETNIEFYFDSESKTLKVSDWTEYGESDYLKSNSNSFKGEYLPLHLL